MKKRTISFLLTILILLCSVACKKQETTTSQTTVATATSIEKPETITVMWDNTMPTEDGKAETFAKELSKKLGIEIKLVTPPITSYYDVLEASFVSETVPDVFVLSADKYAYYAKTGALWDMKNAWDNSELKASGRLEEWAINRLSTLEIEGKDKRKGMYGFSIRRGVSFATVVRTAWLEECNLEAPKNYEEYLHMCNTFRERYNTAPISIDGFLSDHVYIPEFCQSACFDFYKNENGEWVDGFTEQRTKEAFLRIQQTDGIIDSYGLNIAYEKLFLDEKIGVATLPHTALKGLEKVFKQNNIEDDRITVLEPIEEVGCYRENQSYVLAINNKANNPEGIFKYFIESIYDGGEVQSLWTYGVKGVHWDYVDGNLVGQNVISPLLSLGEIDADKDPATASKTPVVSETIKRLNTVLNKYGKTEPVKYDTSEIDEYLGDIVEKRGELFYYIIFYNKDIEKAYQEYNEAVGAKVEKCLNILNK